MVKTDAAHSVDRPEPGYFRMRLVRRGPFVACRIWRCCSCTVNGGDENEQHDWQATCDRFPQLTATVNGEDRSEKLSKVWTYGKPIKRSEYDFMVADAAWLRQHDPEDAKATPTAPVDIKNQPIPF